MNTQHSFPFVLGFSLLLAFFFAVVGAAFVFAVGLGFSPLWWGFYLVGGLVGAFLFSWRRWGKLLGVILAHFLIVWAGAFMGSQIVDVGWDSIETHQRAVTLIEKGWNPIQVDREWDGRQPPDGIVRSQPQLHTAWLDFNAMYVMAALYAQTPYGFEAAKGFHLSLVLMLGFLAYAVLRASDFGKWSAIALTLMAVANPIFYYQWWTLYMDFDVAAYASIALISIFCLSYRWSLPTFFVAVLSLLLLALSKKAGFAFAAAFTLVLGLQIVFLGLRGKPFWVRWGVPGFLLILVLLITVISGVTGRFGDSDRRALPYGWDTVKQLVWEPDNFDRSLDLKVPPSIEGTTRPWQFLRSLFERTQMVRGGDLKLPMTWDGAQLRTLRIIKYPGFESGGFGIFFSGILVLALVARILSPSLGAQGLIFRFLLYAGIVGICFIFPSWWARWVPFVWLLPWFFCAEVWYTYQKSENTLHKRSLSVGTGGGLPFLCVLLAILLSMINSVLIFQLQWQEQRSTTDRITQVFADWQESDGTVKIDFGRSVMVKRWFLDRDMTYTIAEELSGRGTPIPGTSASFWVQEENCLSNELSK